METQLVLHGSRLDDCASWTLGRKSVEKRETEASDTRRTPWKKGHNSRPRVPPSAAFLAIGHVLCSCPLQLIWMSCISLYNRLGRPFDPISLSDIEALGDLALCPQFVETK